jgi:hypothetical protein
LPDPRLAEAAVPPADDDDGEERGERPKEDADQKERRRLWEYNMQLEAVVRATARETILRRRHVL